MFNNSQGFTINNEHGSIANIGGDFYQVQTDHGQDGLKILQSHVAMGALHDDEAEFSVSPCHEETRHVLRTDIMNWIHQSPAVDGTTNRNKLLWLKGPAGSGKSAIMKTISDLCEAEGSLAASFFFSHQSAERNHKKRLIATISYQLAQRVEALRAPIARSAAKDESILRKGLGKQLEALIVEPIQSLATGLSPPEFPRVIVIDGIDECSEYEEKQEILQTLEDFVIHHQLPFVILIATRLEQPMLRYFEGEAKTWSQEIMLDDRYAPSLDIFRLLNAELEVIRRKYQLEDSQWPGEEAIDKIVSNASGQFVYAATVLRFIDDPVSRDPKERMKDVLLIRKSEANNHPFSQLDALYTAILEKCPEPRLSAMYIQLFRIVVNVGGWNSVHRRSWSMGGVWPFNPLYRRSHAPFNLLDPSSIPRRLLELDSYDVERIFGGFHSLVDFSPPSNVTLEKKNPNTPLHVPRFYHKSLFDYLEDPQRAGNLFVSSDVISMKFMTQLSRFSAAYGGDRTPWRGGNIPPPNVDSYRFVRGNKLTLRDHPLRISNIFHYSLEKLRVSTVKWWVQRLVKKNEVIEINGIFVRVHLPKCHWYKCTPFCALWRKTIISDCKQAGWVVPSDLVLLYDNISFHARMALNKPLITAPQRFFINEDEPTN